MYTKIEELLGGFIGVHLTFFENGEDVLVGVVAGDLFNVLDRLPEVGRNRNPSTTTHVRKQKNFKQKFKLIGKFVNLSIK